MPRVYVESATPETPAGTFAAMAISPSLLPPRSLSTVTQDGDKGGGPPLLFLRRFHRCTPFTALVRCLPSIIAKLFILAFADHVEHLDDDLFRQDSPAATSWTALGSRPSPRHVSLPFLLLLPCFRFSCPWPSATAIKSLLGGTNDHLPSVSFFHTSFMTVSLVPLLNFVRSGRT